MVIFLLSGCSSGQSTTTTTKQHTTEQSTSTQPYSFYKDAKVNERLYYIVSLDGESFGKDTVIDGILHINHGNYTYYVTNKDHTMGDLKGLSDRKILALAEKWNKAASLSKLKEAKEKWSEVKSDNNAFLSALVKKI